MTDEPKCPTTDTEDAEAYRAARKRAGEMGYASLNDALDALANKLTDR